MPFSLTKGNKGTWWSLDSFLVDNEEKKALGGR